MFFTCTRTIAIVLQLSGRARRNGQSLCVLYYNAKQKIKDTDLMKYCDDKDKENCRRVLLLKALGDTLRYSRDASKCCDRCNHEGIPVPTSDLMSKRK